MTKGFTLLELIIVVIILGILISIAVPRFQDVQEKGRLTEGIRILGDLRRAQLRYYGLTNDPQHFTDNLLDLDIVISSTRYYDTITLYNPCQSFGLMSCGVAFLKRNTTDLGGFPVYWVFITRDGSLYCTDGGSNASCDKIGIDRLF